MRLTGLLSVLALLAGLWHVTQHLVLAPPGLSAAALTVLAGALLAGVLAGLARGAQLGRMAAVVPLARRSSALREKSWCAAFLPQRDPDAAGRPRPRAPSAVPAAAAS